MTITIVAVTNEDSAVMEENRAVKELECAMKEEKREVNILESTMTKKDNLVNDKDDVMIIMICTRIIKDEMVTLLEKYIIT